LIPILRRRAGWLLLLLVLVPALLGTRRPAGLGDVQDVRTWSYPTYTRVVLELDREVVLPAEGLVRLAANPKAGRPERLYLDVPGIWVGRRFEQGIPLGDGLLQSVRLGQNTLTRSRMVIDLERYDRHRLFVLSSPTRIVVDIFGDRHGGPADSDGRLPAELRRVHTVVVDAGHGGRDPGASGVGGLREKDVTLSIARHLARGLDERGFRVVMTRNDDRSLDLEERTAIAESAAGDVFVSIHANASRRRQARGIEIYTLDTNHQRHSLNVAARESGVPAARLDALQRALATLRVDQAASHSERLASLVHHNVLSAARKHDVAIPDLGVKRGPFYVLFMSSMPSVLVETGFLTNRQDAALLGTDRYRRLIAHEIAEGIDHYRQQTELGLTTRGPGPSGVR